MIKLMHKKVLGKKGFTILELLVVVAIIAILAVVAVPQFLGAIDKARVSGQLADTAAVAKAATMYQFDNSAWPTASNVLTIRVENATTGEENGPYIDKVPTVNKWGGNFDYKTATFSDLDANKDGLLAAGGKADNTEPAATDIADPDYAPAAPAMFSVLDAFCLLP